MGRGSAGRDGASALAQEPFKTIAVDSTISFIDKFYVPRRIRAESRRLSVSTYIK